MDAKLVDDIAKWGAQHEVSGGGEARAYWIIIRLLVEILQRLEAK